MSQLRPIRMNEFMLAMYRLTVETPEAQTRASLSALFMSAQVTQRTDQEIGLSMGEWNFTVRSNSLPWHETYDGGVVIDWHLQTRELLQMLCSPAVGKRFTKTAAEMADWYRSVCLSSFSGGEGAGAVCSKGKWHISTRWLPITPPKFIDVGVALHDDPFSYIGRSYTAEQSLQAENFTKAMKNSVDPLFHIFKVGGATKLTVPEYTFTDVQELFKKWCPQFVHNGGDAMDIVTRAGTFVGDINAADWDNPAFDETFDKGRVLAALQPPVLFDQRAMWKRIVTDSTGTWFIKSDTDYKLNGPVDAACLAALSDHVSCKMSWHCQRLAVKLEPGTQVAALFASPLYFVYQETRFVRALEVTTKRFVPSDQFVAWVNSDPAAPQALQRFVPLKGKLVSNGWLTKEEEKLLITKGYVT